MLHAAIYTIITIEMMSSSHAVSLLVWDEIWPSSCLKWMEQLFRDRLFPPYVMKPNKLSPHVTSRRYAERKMLTDDNAGVAGKVLSLGNEFIFNEEIH